MKIANFWLERDYLTVKVSSEGAFKDKNNGARKLVEVWSNYTKKMRAQLKPIKWLYCKLKILGYYINCV